MDQKLLFGVRDLPMTKGDIQESVRRVFWQQMPREAMDELAEFGERDEDLYPEDETFMSHFVPPDGSPWW